MHELYRRYGPALLRKCERMLGNRADAEDVVQGLFIELHRKGRTDLGLAYLYRAATTRCLNQLRNRRRRRELLERHGEALAPVRTGHEEQLVSALLLARLVEGLDARDAEILVYAWQDHMSQEEVGQLLGLSRKTVGKRLARIRAQAEALGEPLPAGPVDGGGP